MKYQTNSYVKRNELIELGSVKKVRANRHFRLEGKDYIVRDVDIPAFDKPICEQEHASNEYTYLSSL